MDLWKENAGLAPLFTVQWGRGKCGDLKLFFCLHICIICGVFFSVPEVEGEADSISSLCSQITNAFSTPSEDPFSSAPMTKPVTAVAPQSPAVQGMSSLHLSN